MPIIDAHCHFWRLDRGDYGWLDGSGGPLEPIRRDFLPPDYPGDARLIVVQAAPTVAETEFMLALARQDARIAGVVGWVDIADRDAASVLRRLANDPALRGIRPMLQDIADPDWLVTDARADALRALADLGLCFDALVTARHLPMLAWFAARHPELTIVIDHAAKPQPGSHDDWAAGMRALARLPHVRCKLSGLLTELAPQDRADPLDPLGAIVGPLLDWFGPDRLIWGSDWPVLTLAGSWQGWRDLTDALLAGLTPTEADAIMRDNAARAYGVAA